MKKIFVLIFLASLTAFATISNASEEELLTTIEIVYNNNTVTSVITDKNEIANLIESRNIEGRDINTINQAVIVNLNQDELYVKNYIEQELALETTDEPTMSASLFSIFSTYYYIKDETIARMSDMTIPIDYIEVDSNPFYYSKNYNYPLVVADAGNFTSKLDNNQFKKIGYNKDYVLPVYMGWAFFDFEMGTPFVSYLTYERYMVEVYKDGFFYDTYYGTTMISVPIEFILL